MIISWLKDRKKKKQEQVQALRKKRDLEFKDAEMELMSQQREMLTKPCPFQRRACLSDCVHFKPYSIRIDNQGLYKSTPKCKLWKS